MKKEREAISPPSPRLSSTRKIRPRQKNPPACHQNNRFANLPGHTVASSSQAREEKESFHVPKGLAPDHRLIFVSLQRALNVGDLRAT